MKNKTNIFLISIMILIIILVLEELTKHAMDDLILWFGMIFMLEIKK